MTLALSKTDVTGIDYHTVGPLFEQLHELRDDAERACLRERIITICMPLAEHVAYRFNGRGQPLDDLVQVASLGLVKAVDRFDVTMGRNFLSFAVPTIMGEVRRYFRDNTWAAHVPRGIKEIHLRLRVEVERLTSDLGRAPTVQELATVLDVDPEDVTFALQAGNSYSYTSTDAADDADGFGSISAARGADDQGYEHVEDYLTVGPLIADLPDREKSILMMRFFDFMTQSQIAAQLGISQMQVSRILAKILSGLRDQARERGVEYP
jgi:RNA polymerase sigma-B factor